MINQQLTTRLGLSVALVLLGTPLAASALSFVEGTVFLDVNSEEECIAEGGNYMEWYGEIYCTQSPDTTVSVAATSSVDTPSFEDMQNAQVEAARSLDLLGLSESEAKAVAANADVTMRVVSRDGEFFAVTMDYRPGRINATVQNDVVVQYEIEGTSDVFSLEDITKPVAVPSTETPVPSPESQPETTEAAPAVTDEGVDTATTSPVVAGTTTQTVAAEESVVMRFIEQIVAWFAFWR